MAVDRAKYQARRDRELRALLVEDQGVKLAQKRIDQDTSGYGFYGRRRLLVSALRVSRSMHPALAGAIDACRDVLGFTQPLEVYIRPDPSYGAFVMQSPTGPLALGITSSLLEAFTPAELRFVLGHELGHCVFDHMSLPMPLTATIEDMAGPLVSRATAIRLYLWCRSAELSADRAGLVCAGDLDAAATAFFKLSSGLAHATVGADLHKYLSQVDALAAAPVGRRKPRDEDDTLECFSTHPYAPLRMRALCAYARTDAYRSLGGHLGGGLSGEGMAVDALTLEAAEEMVERDLDVMEPSYLEEKSDEAELLRRLLFLLGLQVAYAHEGAHDKEIRALKALVGTDPFAREPNAETAKSEADDKTKLARDKASRLRRTQLVQHLTIIAAADGDIDPAEAAVMYGAAAALDVPLSVVDDTLRASASPMD